MNYIFGVLVSQHSIAKSVFFVEYKVNWDPERLRSDNYQQLLTRETFRYQIFGTRLSLAEYTISIEAKDMWDHKRPSYEKLLNRNFRALNMFASYFWHTLPNLQPNVKLTYVLVKMFHSAWSMPMSFKQSIPNVN